MRRKRDTNYSNPNLGPVRGDTVPDSMCNLKLATQADCEAAWRGCQSAIRKWLAHSSKPTKRKGP